MNKIVLPQVTLVCMSCLDVEGAIRSINLCQEQCEFADVVLLTSLPTTCAFHRAISPVSSYGAVSRFYIRSLYKHVSTSHLLLVEPDSWICNARKWNPEWMSYDYIGGNAIWTEDGPDGKGGNGGFALHSRRLLALAAQIIPGKDIHPHDIVLSALPSPSVSWMKNGKRSQFEAQGMRFATRAVQQDFSIDNGIWVDSFGHHKCTNKLSELGISCTRR